MTKAPDFIIKPEFPRSAKYDAGWMIENQMGPNALWLVEWLTEELQLKPGMKVLDLGCGRAITSIFLAKEFDVQVWAADLWISPGPNHKRVVAAGLEDTIFPIRAEAHALPFADDFFDAIISIDAYQYFGTDVLYLGYLLRFLKPGGCIGMVVPGLMQEINEVPSHLANPQTNGKIFWEDECWSFKTATWWKEHWSRNRNISINKVDTLKDGWRHWRDSEKAIEAVGSSPFPSEVEALEKDLGGYIGFVRAIAQRTGDAGENLYDSAVGVIHGMG
jgi:cyclopropane fatty-acyl-phospholipid synthase-like methyltransferase